MFGAIAGHIPLTKCEAFIMTDNTLTVSTAIAACDIPHDFGKHQKATADDIERFAKHLLDSKIKPEWIPTDSFKDGNPIHLEVFLQVGEGYLTTARFAKVRMTGKKEVAELTVKQKEQRESDRRVIRRLTMSLLTQTVFVMGGGNPAGLNGNKAPKTEWHADEKRMAALMALHDSASGTDKVPQQQYELEFQQLLKPAVDFLRSKSSAANKIHAGYGQQYKGSFSIKKTK